MDLPKTCTFLLLSLFSFLGINFVYAQNTDKDFQRAHDRIHTKKIFTLDPSDPLQYKRDSMEVVEIHHLLDVLKGYMDKEHDLAGNAGFAFNGNQSDLNNLFKVGVNAKMSKGAYPYEFDFNINVQTTIQNGQFQENLSDIDVSFDFHPIVPDINTQVERTDGKRADGLWLESFAFVKRFNNSFLGIEQRYETGVGFIFNFFSKNKLTKTGQNNRKAMEEIPKYDVYGDDLARCLTECYVKKSILDITQNEAQAISNTRERYQRSNIKKYSKWRTGLLVGVYYELEDALAANEILFNGEMTPLSRDFEATNKIRLEFRPIFSFQPKDGYRLKIYPYFKLPIGSPNSVVVSPEGVRDVRYDWFLDAQSSFDIRLEEGFSISFMYRLFYDHAPKRAFIEQDDGSYALLVGQKLHSNFGVGFNFGF